MTRRWLTPRRWTPPPAPADGGRTPRTAPFALVRRLATGGHGPEDVVFDRRGHVLTGTGDGRIVRIDPADGQCQVLGTTGGRPLGLEACADGSVLVCDHDRGLLRLHADGRIETLVDTVDGEPLRFASNVVQGADGTIWFTTSTSRWDLEHYLGDLLEHSCTGRLIRRDPDGRVSVLLRDLRFGNGLVLAPDGSHLLYVETAGYRIRRYPLTGPGAGEPHSWVDNLPGHPDNMSLGSDGLVWVAIAAPRNRLLDRLLPWPGVLRTVVWNLPEAIRPAPTPIAWVMAFDLDGTLVHDLRSTDCGYGFATSVAEHHGTVVVGSLHEDDIAVIAPPTVR